MSQTDSLERERQYLSNLLEAIQRCVYFLNRSERKLPWPLTGRYLEQHKKDVDLFETMAAVNERFAKLQDTEAAAMRHGILLMSEPHDTFLKILSVFEKNGVIESIEAWQRSRTARNLAAHDYETDYAEIADHFNTLHDLSPMLYATAKRLVAHFDETLNVNPASHDFRDEFQQILAQV